MNFELNEINTRLKKVGLFLWIVPAVFCGFILKPQLETYLFEGMMIDSYPETAAIRSRILAKKYQKALPLTQKGIEKVSLSSRAGTAVLIKFNGDKKVLFEKNSSKPLPIASISKLMTTLVALENYDLNQKVIFSKEASGREGGPNFFKAGDSFYVSDLLYSALVESSNRAAYALSEIMGEKEFVSMMNQKAVEFEMEKTKFFNPTGLDPDLEKANINQSSAEDLVLLAEYLIEKPIIGQICKTESRAISQVNGDPHHIMKTTNELLGKVSNIALAKTGSTPIAGECLLIVLEKPKYGIVVNVILGSKNNFLEMEKLINWVDNAYKW